MAELQVRRFSFFFCAFLAFSSGPYPIRFALGAPSAAERPIKTLVILVLENRSFDHMLGWMKRSVNPSIDGVTGGECNPISSADSAAAAPVCFTDGARFVDADPDHTYEAVAKQVFGSSPVPSMAGFAEQARSVSPNLSATVMSGFNPESIPVYAALVREFAVFDRWFSSIPGPTQPNRLFLYSATSHGAVGNVKKQLAAGFPQKTIFDSLDEDGVGFGIYYQSVPNTLFYRNLRKLRYAFKHHLYDLKFRRHAREGRLPDLTVIEPRYFDLKGFPANDDHPAHDVANGQRLVKEVYEAVRAGPQWNQTLLVITYDEHGGFFDHVETPYRNVPSPDGIASPAPDFFKFDRLGVRVPTIMASPWIAKGTVIGRPKGPAPDSEFEHSSIPATLKKMFNLTSGYLTRRDAWAGTFDHVVGELSSPRTDCPEVLPDVAPLRSSEANEGGGLSQFQAEMVDLAAVLTGDHFLSSFRDGGAGREMSVKEADEYVSGAVARFFSAAKVAARLGADESAVVNMRSSLTSRSPKN